MNVRVAEIEKYIIQRLIAMFVDSLLIGLETE